MNEKSNKITKLSTEAYKGVRDFYPEDMAVQKYIFEKMRNVSESFGYNEYDASVLEPSELYRNKTSEEIVNEQTYTFKDRGDRDVTLRPEMTPTIARMVAAKKQELAFPLRWYSIPNLFRYEKPQRGRLREHWQLNVDIFGVSSIEAEIEIISMASEIMKSFGLKDADFEIRLNSRKIMNYILLDLMSLNENTAHKICRLIDKKDKISKEDFEASIKELLPEESSEFLVLINSKNFEEFVAKLPKSKEVVEKVDEIREVMARLEKLGITNTVFDQTLMRGFDYYTGIVFEVFDKNPENSRSIFGGGRYDDLLTIFDDPKTSESSGKSKVPAVGFGMGDVVIRNILETYKLLPEYQSEAQLYICVMNKDYYDYAQEMAQKLREDGIKVAIDFSGKKIGDQIKSADKQKIPYIICLGENEMKSGEFKVKNLKTGEEKVVSGQGLSLVLKGESLSSK
jgi:histidyl-tRNA synthetase